LRINKFGPISLFYGLGQVPYNVVPMKETPRRRITVTSSVDKVSTDQLGNRVVVRGRGINPPTPTPFYSTVQQASGQIFKDDGAVFLHLVYLLKGIVSYLF
jgi:hypothetical protein